MNWISYFYLIIPPQIFIYSLTSYHCKYSLLEVIINYNVRKKTVNYVAQCTWSVFNQFTEMSSIKVDVFPDNTESRQANIKTTLSELGELTYMSFHDNYSKNKKTKLLNINAYYHKRTIKTFFK